MKPLSMSLPWALVALWSVAWMVAFFIERHPLERQPTEFLRLGALVLVPTSIVAAGQWMARRFDRFLESLEGE